MTLVQNITNETSYHEHAPGQHLVHRLSCQNRGYDLLIREEPELEIAFCSHNGECSWEARGAHLHESITDLDSALAWGRSYVSGAIR